MAGAYWELYRFPTVNTVIYQLFSAPVTCRHLSRVQLQRAFPHIRGKRAVEEGTWKLTSAHFRIFLCCWHAVGQTGTGFQFLSVLSLSPPFLSVSYVGGFLSYKSFILGTLFSWPYWVPRVNICMLLFILNILLYKHLYSVGKTVF